MKIKFKKLSPLVTSLPNYSCKGDAGMDVMAAIEEPITLNSLERRVIPTGIAAEIPMGYEIQVRPRSGLAAKYGITVLNSPGTIDSGYKDEIKVILVNLSKDPYTIQPGERIAQLVLCKLTVADEIIEVTEIDVSNNRNGGLGHTGKF